MHALPKKSESLLWNALLCNKFLVVFVVDAGSFIYISHMLCIYSFILFYVLYALCSRTHFRCNHTRSRTTIFFPRFYFIHSVSLGLFFLLRKFIWIGFFMALTNQHARHVFIHFHYRMVTFDAVMLLFFSFRLILLCFSDECVA